MNFIVQELLQHDRECRNKVPDDTKDLFVLEDLNYKSSWDYSLPTLTKNDNVFTKRKIKKLDINEFNKRFYDKYPYFESPTFRWNNLMIAGGSLENIISDKSVNDIDIFMFGLDEDEANMKIMGILDDLQRYADNCNVRNTHIEKKRDHEKLKIKDVIRKKLNLTFTIKHKKSGDSGYPYEGDKIQIIFRLYKTRAEILHGFDLGSSAVGYSGSRLYFTALSKFCYEHMCNIVDTTRRSTTYEKRLMKYFNRDFEIILPELDISKCSTENILLYKEYREFCSLPFLAFTYSNVIDNKIILSRFYPRIENEQFVSDYDDDIDDEFKAFYSNLCKILQGKYDDMIFILGDEYGEIFNITENIFSEDKIRYFYNNIYNKIVNSDKFPTKLVKTYLPYNRADAIYSYSLLNDPTKIKEIIAVHIKEIMDRRSQVNYDTIKWITENPGTQLTSSFNPIIENPKKWYGKYFLN